MSKQKTRTYNRQLRHKRCRKRITGTAQRPRMCVFISNRYAYAQVVDDERGATVCSVSTLGKEARAQFDGKTMTEAAAILGKAVAEKAIAAGVKEIVFDRSGYKYGKRLKALCDAAREAGLVF